MRIGAKGMNKQKVSILALIVAFALCVAAACLSVGFMGAGAAANVTYSGVFTTSGATKEDSEDNYLTYKLGEGGTVTLRKNLALKWYSFADAENKTVTDAGAAQYFTLKLSLADSVFTSFTVAMESTQMSMSKEGKTVNEVVFTPADGGKVNVSVNDAEGAVALSAADLTISFTGDDGNGNFDVSVSDGTDTVTGTFANVGKYYAQYASSSATTPITPLTFKAEGKDVLFSVKELNGQSFLLDADEKIADNVAPALVINSEIKQLVLGEQIDFDYVAIDVCSTSITTTRYYLVEGMPVMDGEEEVTAKFDEEGKLVGYNDLDSDKRFNETDFPDNDIDGGALSIAFRLTDGNSNSGYYFIEWYAGGTLNMVNPNSVETTPEVQFVSTTDNAVDADNKYADNITAYQNAVTQAALKDGKSIQVGSGAYYYIPSLKAYISDDSCGYTDMKFTVYYRTNTSDTQTVSGEYDDLRIPVSTEGDYAFRVVPTNSAGNVMIGLIEQADGTYRPEEVSSSNVWDVKNLVTFTFSVRYYGASIEEPEEAETGYRDATYTVEDFEIIALSGYKTEYKLFLFEANSGVTVSSISQIKEAEQADGTNTLGTWKEISKYDSSLADDEGDNLYNWNPDNSLSFVPQEMGYYKVQVTVDDQSGITQNEDGSYPSAYQIIGITAEAVVIPGTTYWLQNNILSVVFLGVGVLCLIGIVVLLVVKPKDKVAEDKAREEELKNKRAGR